jgi:ADP-ribose pyrophosphatase YjhB (NUDIX family)
MKFCPDCGGAVQLRIPPGDNRPRATCDACGAVHYQNPRIVVGCIPERHGRILLCQRAIDPRRGFWTFPAGFYEIGETLAQAAERESLEEALAHVQVGSLLAVTHLLHAAQVHMTFRAMLLDDNFGVGAESLRVGLYEEGEIPWGQLAFASIDFALRCYFADRSAGREQLHFSTAERAVGGGAAAGGSRAL